MPTLHKINNIKINVYNGDHRPPHIHAVYNEYEILIEIESKNIYAGNLPAKQLKMVQQWLAENDEWMLEIFYELNPQIR